MKLCMLIKNNEVTTYRKKLNHTSLNACFYKLTQVGFEYTRIQEIMITRLRSVLHSVLENDSLVT